MASRCKAASLGQHPKLCNPHPTPHTVTGICVLLLASVRGQTGVDMSSGPKRGLVAAACCYGLGLTAIILAEAIENIFVLTRYTPYKVSPLVQG